MIDRPADDDPETGGAPVQRVFHPVAVHFKGKGFYNTDYGTKRRKRELEKSAKDGADKTRPRARSPRQAADAKSSSSGRRESRLAASPRPSKASSTSAATERPQSASEAAGLARRRASLGAREAGTAAVSVTRLRGRPRRAVARVAARRRPPAREEPSSVGPAHVGCAAPAGRPTRSSGRRTNADRREQRGASSRRGSSAGAARAVRSSSLRLQRFLRVRASASACLPSMCGLAGRQAQRVAAVLEAAVDARDDAAAVVGDAAHRVDERGEVARSHLDRRG